MPINIFEILRTPYGKELESVAKLSAEIFFQNKMLDDGNKKWVDVEKEFNSIYMTLKNKQFNKIKNKDEKEKLNCLVKVVLSECDKIRGKYNP